MKKTIVAAALTCAMATSASALAETFSAGSLIIPMDTDYQDAGMFKAYGVVYELLRNDIPVHWTIRPEKTHMGSDFTASAVDHDTDDVITAHPYRGGPWVVDADAAADALSVIDAWQAKHVTTVHAAVHVATEEFTADVARELIVAPTIAMFADGSESIARAYLVAAGIPDSQLNYAWPNTSPDLLTPLELAGPTKTNHADGRLFDGRGNPAYCQFMSMHYKVDDARANPEVVAEVRQFLMHPVHFFAECQAVNAFENDLTNGLFLTKTGFDIGVKLDNKPVAFYNSASPFAQIDGAFGTVGGSEPTYSIPASGGYKRGGIVMITEASTPEGKNDVWMTGYLDGICGEGDLVCNGLGKVSYLGGHSYTTKVPISENPTSQGTRLFLNSLFEAPCATTVGQPQIWANLDGPSITVDSEVSFTIEFRNDGLSGALDTGVRAKLPEGTSFISATGGGQLNGDVVEWDLGTLGRQESGSVSFTIALEHYGTFSNDVALDYRVGLNHFTIEVQGVLEFVYDADTDSDGVVDGYDNCPDDYNPGQNLMSDVRSCGTCGVVCTVTHGTPVCRRGSCQIVACDASHADCDRDYETGCEYDTSSFADDGENCGACGSVCAPQNATASCSDSQCTLIGCDAGHSDCNGLIEDGCEYDNTGFQSDANHCGDCETACDRLTQVCHEGACVTSQCPAGSAECALPEGDCETDIASDADHCGGCGVVCRTPDATPACVAGQCSVGECDAGHSDCNGLPGDGCEYSNADFAADMNNCGGCGVVCDAANADQLCLGGACSIVACEPGFSDCNGLAGDGCEYDSAEFDSDALNCGACGQACEPANAAGVCEDCGCTMGDCNDGFVDLDDDPATGCEYACTVQDTEDASCDNIDDDCDGLVDEDYEPYRCGVGTCAAASACAEGEEFCTPGAPADEGPEGSPTCTDGVDNDCDGKIDGADTHDCGSSTSDPGNGTGGAAGAGNTNPTDAGAADAGSGTDASAGSGATETHASAGTDAASAPGGSAGADATSDPHASGAGTASSNADAGSDGDGTRSGSAGAGASSTSSQFTNGGTSSDSTHSKAGAAPIEAGGSSGSAERAPSDESGAKGGCGCRVTNTRLSSGWLFGVLALTLVGIRRRGWRRPCHGCRADFA
jgi:uncharacterized repeat protein (TIGR01451 family)/MYXO-CTERM domain-containing protein